MHIIYINVYIYIYICIYIYIYIYIYVYMYSNDRKKYILFTFYVTFCSFFKLQIIL